MSRQTVHDKVKTCDHYVPLIPGTVLRTSTGSLAEVIGSTTRRGEFEVFNLEVEGAHNYFVADADVVDGPGVLVHNGACGVLSRARTVISGLDDALFARHQCVECGDAIVDALRNEGISGQVLHIRANHGDFLVSDLVGSGTALTQNGYHTAIRIGDTVFDNFFRSGVSYDDYVQAIHGVGGVTINTVPF